MEKLPQEEQVTDFSFKGTYFFVKKVVKTSTEQVGTTLALVHSAFYKYIKACLDFVQSHICCGECFCGHVSTINHDSHQCNS
jgi:hypothetical protein